MNTQRPTPRTDAHQDDMNRVEFDEELALTYNFARDLERELAHANEEVAFYSDACDRNAVLLAGVKSENEAMRAAIQETIMENLHLADGDVCTLKRLKDVIGFSMPETPTK